MNTFELADHFENALKKCLIKYTCVLGDELSFFNVRLNTINIPGLCVTVSFDDYASHIVKLSCELEMCTDHSKRSALLELFNTIMYDFKFVRFVITDEYCIKADCNILILDENGHSAARQIFMNMLTLAEVCDNAYPHIINILENDHPTYSGGVRFGAKGKFKKPGEDGDVVVDTELLDTLVNRFCRSDDDGSYREYLEEAFEELSDEDMQ